MQLILRVGDRLAVLGCICNQDLAALTLPFRPSSRLLKSAVYSVSILPWNAADGEGASAEAH